MPKAEKGSIKYLANKMKAKGLQKLRWYCQMCQKQCRDENGFKCHTTSESHQRQLLLFAENPYRYLDEFSREFAQGYIELLRRRFGTKRVSANQIYQEYISEKNHLHMNATKWLSLTGFVKWLGREGHCTVDETEKGWFVTWIDKDPETIARQQAVAKKQKMDKDDEERLQEFLDKQVERAKRDSEETTYTELKRETEDEKIVVNLSLSMNGGKEARRDKPSTSNPADVFKTLKDSSSKWETGSSRSTTNSSISSRKPKTALEQIREEEERRKAKKLNRDNWLHEGIVVKVITKRLGDKFYKEKGLIIQVIDKYVAVVRMISTGTKVKLDQEHLETVIPSAGNLVRIVNGEFCGKDGVLQAIHADRFSASVKLLTGSQSGKILDLPYTYFSKVPVESSS